MSAWPGVNTYTGATTVDAGGQLELASGSINSTSAIVNNGAIYIDASGAQTTLAVPTVVISGTGDVNFDGYTDNGGVVEGSDTATPLTATISLAETYSGTTYIENVDLVIASGGSITNSFVELDAYNEDGVAEASTLDISGAGGTVTIAGLSSFQEEGGSTSVILGANRLVLSGVGVDGGDTFNGVISGMGGSLQLNSGVTEAFTASQTYTGSTVVYGTLELEGTARLASSNVSLKAVNGTGGTLDISDATGIAATPGATPTVTVTELTGQFGSHVYLGGNTLEVTETTAASFGGVIANAGGIGGGTGGGLTVDGSVYLTLTNTETYTGVTTINGDLALGAATGASTIGSIAASSGLVDDGFFAISGSATVNDLSGTGVVKIGPAPDVLTVNETAAGTTFSGIIHGAGILNVTGRCSRRHADPDGGQQRLLRRHAPHQRYAGVGGSGCGGSGAITFENSAATLALTNAALTGGNTATESFGNTLDIAAHGGTVDLMDLTFEASNPMQTFAVGANGSLTITEGNVHVTFMTDLTSGTMVTASGDGAHGTHFMIAAG